MLIPKTKISNSNKDNQKAQCTKWCITSSSSSSRALVTVSVVIVAFAFYVFVDVEAQGQVETSESAGLPLVSAPLGTSATAGDTAAVTTTGIKQPNPPPWSDYSSIRIFRPTDSSDYIQETIASLTSELTNRKTGHFSNQRYAFLFHPGTYFNVSFEVGYYVQVLGLGPSPNSVRFLGPCTANRNNNNKGGSNNSQCSSSSYEVGPRCGCMDRRVNGAGSLDTFWRSVENVRISNTNDRTMVWAVSQAAPLRRLKIDGNLDLFEGYCRKKKTKSHMEGSKQQEDCGAYYASGGFMANVNVDGYVNFGSQQQFLSRNVNFGKGSGGGAWNLVFVGCSAIASSSGDGSPKKGLSSSSRDDSPDLVRTVDDIPRVRVEKPYVIVRDGALEDGTKQERYKLVVPKAIVAHDIANIDTTSLLVGPDLQTNEEGNDVRDFSNVLLARPGVRGDSHKTLQTALDNGLDVVFSPGVYRLGRTLTVKRSGSVLLGLGLATLIAPEDGSPILHVLPKVNNVRIAGFILEANVLTDRHGDGESLAQYPLSSNKQGITDKKSVLLLWGSPGVDDDPGDAKLPGVLSDIFCRVGGTAPYRRDASVDIMVQLYSGNIVGDHLWLWRPDHAAKLPSDVKKTGYGNSGSITETNSNSMSEYHLVQRGEYPCTTGLQVMGDNVTIHGLAVEHMTGDMVVWRGNHGAVRFYQSELPYEVTQEEYGGPSNAFVSYHVDEEHVSSHNLAGGGVYSFFRDHDVQVDMAFRHPRNGNNSASSLHPQNSTNHSNNVQVNMTNVFTRFLDGKGSIRSVVNMNGHPVTNRDRMSRVELSS